MTSAAVITVGSINIDLVVYTRRFPHAGETFSGEKFIIGAGGKGANQAIQAALNGVHSYMVGRLGQDIFATYIYDVFKKCGVDFDFVIEDQAGTGVGHVTVNEQGDYASVIIAQANGNLSPQDVDAAEQAFTASKVLLLQLEVPMETVIYAARKAYGCGLKVILNAAPAVPLPVELDEVIDILVINEIEAQMLSQKIATGKLDGYYEMLKTLKERYRNIIITLGADGLISMDKSMVYHRIEGYKVPVANTVGAGDAFIGELAARLAEGMDFSLAIRYANAAGALAVTQATSYGTPNPRSQLDQMVANAHYSSSDHP